MLLRAYSIFDNKALQYHPPFFASTDGAAVRSLTDLANDLQTQIGRHPGDYVLFCIGEYDDQKGMFRQFMPLVHVVDAISVVTAREPSPLFPQPSSATPREFAGLKPTS